ncbi:MAG: GFA family protein, partial [Gammaproteobacteria bacterium]|nr:GFA family protein [Gammaproteobacteria bacterium]
GTSFALNALIEADRVTLLQGQLEKVATPSNSGKGQDIFRCPQCHIAVWSNYGGLGDKVDFVRVGTLDEAHRLSPDMHIFTASKQPWVVIPEGQLVFEEYYNNKKYWPAESLTRLREALGLPVGN